MLYLFAGVFGIRVCPEQLSLGVIQIDPVDLNLWGLQEHHVTMIPARNHYTFSHDGFPLLSGQVSWLGIGGGMVGLVCIAPSNHTSNHKDDDSNSQTMILFHDLDYVFLSHGLVLLLIEPLVNGPVNLLDAHTLID